MRCPKCNYLSFDSGERCRHCGYDFSLAGDAAELPIRVGGTLRSIGDLVVEDPGPAAHAGPASGTSSPEFDLDLGRAVPAQEGELPLFTDRSLDHMRPVAPPAAARPPLAVRRGTPEAVRLKTKPSRRRPPEVPALDLEAAPAAADDPPDETAGLSAPRLHQPEPGLTPATPLDRVAAGLIDVILLVGIDAAVLDLTLKAAGLNYSEWRLLPWAPLAGFFVLLNGGYFATFTAAGGQTIGKMLRQIKVVGKHGTLHAGQVVLRTAAYAASALPAGLGFAAGLMGAERLALHDRLADTRVVKVVSS